VRNSPPRGAAFTIWFPVLSVPPSPRSQRPSRVQENLTGKVLLVDDDETLLQLEHEVLRSRGITVKLARSAREAVDFLRRDSVDAVVTDMKMPGEISSLAFYRWIVESRPELAARVVFTASHARENEASAALRKSGCPVVSKPFAIEEFWTAIQKVLAAEVSSPVRH